MEFVSNAQTITFSMFMEFAVKSNPNVKISTDKLESVKLVIKAMELSMDNASELTWSIQMEQVARPGLMENVLNAQPDGTSTQAAFADQLATFAELGQQLANVKHVIQVILLLKVNAFQIQISSDPLKMIFVLFGKKESVLSALTELSSIQTQFANKSQLNALLGIP